MPNYKSMLKKYWIVAIIVAVETFFLFDIDTIPVHERAVGTGWAQVQISYLHRMGLTPQLVELGKAAPGFPRYLLTDAIEAHNAALKVKLTPDQLSNPKETTRFEEAQSEVSRTINQLTFGLGRNPQVKNDPRLAALKKQYVEAEGPIALALKTHIQSVQDYNEALETIRGRFWAWIYEAKPKTSFTSLLSNGR